MQTQPTSNHLDQLDNLQNNHPIAPTPRAARNNGTYEHTGTWQERMPYQNHNSDLQDFTQQRHMQQWVNDATPDNFQSNVSVSPDYPSPSPHSLPGRNPQDNRVEM